MAQLSTHLGKADWEVPFGRVIYGENVLKIIYKEYDDDVSQTKIWREGYDYLHKEFPKLTYIDFCRVIPENEMLFYLKGLNALNDIGLGKIDNDIEHDLNKQLYGDDENENINKNQFELTDSALLIIECFVAILCIAGLVYIAMNFRKTPHKNN